MQKGDYVYTPRFCNVQIKEILDDLEIASKKGYTEPTYYENSGYEILGKHIGTNRMVFAAIKKS